MLRQRQKAILKFLYHYHIQNGFYPTLREIGEGIFISSTSVVKYNLDKRMEMGYLVIQPGRSRTTSLTDSA